MSYGVNAPWGLRPVRLQSGALWNGQANQYNIASGYNTSLFQGDPVYAGTAGNVGFIVIAGAGVGNPITGVLDGVQYTNATGTVVFAAYWPANTVTMNAAPALAAVVDDANVIYNVQVGNSGQGVQQVDLLNNADLIAGAGNTASGQSGWMLDQTTIGNGATKQVKILRLVPDPNNHLDPYNGVAFPYNNVEVVINNDYYKGGTGTVGT